MAEMIVTTPEVKRIVRDYDILLSPGMMLPTTVDESLGDTFVDDGVNIRIHLVSKPSLIDPDRILPAEDILLHHAHIVSINSRLREIVLPDPEQKQAWKKALHEANGTVN